MKNHSSTEIELQIKKRAILENIVKWQHHSDALWGFTRFLISCKSVLHRNHWLCILLTNLKWLLCWRLVLLRLLTVQWNLAMVSQAPVVLQPRTTAIFFIIISRVSRVLVLRINTWGCKTDKGYSKVTDFGKLQVFWICRLQKMTKYWMEAEKTGLKIWR